MIAFLLILLAGAIALVLSFAMTFTVVSLYIVWKRRQRPKFCYSKPAEEPQVRRDTDLDTKRPASPVDGGSAVRDWAGN